MNKPNLLVIAGCNGSGKSSYSSSLSPNGIIPFDYDKHFLKIYNSLLEFDLKDKMAHSKTFDLLEKKIEEAIIKKEDFSYETNFNSDPMHWPNYFIKFGYQIDMIYFCLNSIEEAKRRVMIRVENGGHYVPPAEIEKRFYEGYKNLDALFPQFNNIHLFNNSAYDSEPEHILTIINGKFVKKNNYPDFLKFYLPSISSQL